MSAFKAYDIRGVYDRDFTAGDVYRIGYFLPGLLNSSKVLVGRDVRVSSPAIYTALTDGIRDAGADVYDLGLATTPFVYWSTAQYGFDLSVMITASHNPKEYNGLKISRTNALPVGFDTGLAELELKVKGEEPVVPKPKGQIHSFDKHADYVAFLKSFGFVFDSLKLSVDCSNGMAALFVKDLLGDKPFYLFDELDGSFPNHEPNPLEEHNLLALQEAVKTYKSDIGVIYDGDADRVMFVDENGKFIPPDLMIAVAGHYFLEQKGLRGNVLQDIRTSRSVSEYIEKMGGTMHMWRVGRAYAALKLREIDGIFGGELAGHYYFRDFYYSDSGLLASLLLLDTIARFQAQGVKVSELVARIAKYYNSGEINFKLNRKQEAMDALRKHFEAQETVTAFYDFDGYRVEFKDWWFNVRPSNTEPYLRFLAEAGTQALLDKVVREAREIVEGFAD